MAHDRTVRSARARDDCKVFRLQMNDDWPLETQRLMLLQAAMIMCQVPLSAVEWRKARFTPCLPKLANADRSMHLGLLSRAHHDAESMTVLIAGRHNHSMNRGKDLVVVDPVSKVPIGLVPDFTHTLMEIEQFISRLSRIYGPLVRHFPG
ncbi:hypothetical protein BAUCODRAFT_312893 [Baudoinia panamericana UAMH 10762]|uniref:Uncharacterized protein n=1 Tax=Baudoinia panamericana (strain UAMH 10762) TaxID=717646 RepID=M2MKY0_BAUPA|nr:uncharacterized protein BAUCODRAFT_312893 [Baudoinia panamericana UAMH 10762]EMC91988.1 hypothetical protein BAUCODRAFT_312893 [Baudoinia panamericana UAMH 10762]